jgi:hypothetical protein
MLLTLIGAFYAVDFYFGGRMPDLFKYVRDQVTFQDFERKLHPAVSTAGHVLFASVWLIYFPFSHILKLFFRYYHLLRWDGVLNVRGGEIEKRAQELLDFPVTWSAPHIRPHRTWKEVAADTGSEA